MKTLAERYSYATRIPQSAFTITHEGNSYHVRGTLSALPERFCTVDQICVENSKWYEVFDEKRLAYAEFLEERSKPKGEQAPGCCHCSGHAYQS